MALPCCLTLHISHVIIIHSTPKTLHDVDSKSIFGFKIKMQNLF